VSAQREVVAATQIPLCDAARHAEKRSAGRRGSWPAGSRGLPPALNRPDDVSRLAFLRCRPSACLEASRRGMRAAAVAQASLLGRRRSSKERTRGTATAKTKKLLRSVTAPQVTDLRRSQFTGRSDSFSAVPSGAPQPIAGVRAAGSRPASRSARRLAVAIELFLST
jgi:hypothetical protein